ncbi:MAG: hypothetical protein U0573_10715 [Phycisphaerales bacterium]|nr:hypothetical protein [Planctomycetota bacterium]
MKYAKHILAASLLTGSSSALAQDLVNNGSFESGFSGWVRADQIGSDGSFLLQSGTTSPVNNFTVPSPRSGLAAAMTDSTAGGSHVLYQDIVIPSNVGVSTLRFSLFINNTATAFFTPSSLDWATPALNQQARVDILAAGADPFSIAPADILQNLFLTPSGSPPVSGYTDFAFDISALIASRAGQTIRLRFAETDNVNAFNFGVDAVGLTVPAPATVALLACIPLARRRRSA